MAEASERILSLAFRDAYPIEVDAFEAMKLSIDRPLVLHQPSEVLDLLEPLVANLESRLHAADADNSTP